MKEETQEFCEKFEKVWEKLKKEKGYEGSPENLFLEILDIARSKYFIDDLAKKLGVSTTFLAEFLERFFDIFNFKGEERLLDFLQEVEKGNWILVKGDILEEFEKRNKQRILDFKSFAKLDKYSAKVGLLNLLLEKVPKDLSLWDKFEKLRKEKGISAEDFFFNLLTEEEARTKEDVELIPVSGKNWKKLVELFKKLPENQKDALFKRLQERMNRAVTSTIHDASQLIRKLEKKKR